MTTLPSKNPPVRTFSLLQKPLQAPSKHTSKNHFPLESLLRTLLRSVLLHDPLGVHPIPSNCCESFLKPATWRHRGSWWPPAFESSIAVEDAVENRSLYRVLVSRLFQRGFRHYSITIARLSPLSGLERGGWGLLPVFGCEIGRDMGLPIALPIAAGVL